MKKSGAVSWDSEWCPHLSSVSYVCWGMSHEYIQDRRELELKKKKEWGVEGCKGRSDQFLQIFCPLPSFTHRFITLWCWWGCPRLQGMSGCYCSCCQRHKISEKEGKKTWCHLHDTPTAGRFNFLTLRLGCPCLHRTFILLGLFSPLHILPHYIHETPLVVFLFSSPLASPESTSFV